MRFLEALFQESKSSTMSVLTGSLRVRPEPFDLVTKEIAKVASKGRASANSRLGQDPRAPSQSFLFEWKKHLKEGETPMLELCIVLHHTQVSDLPNQRSFFRQQPCRPGITQKTRRRAPQRTSQRTSLRTSQRTTKKTAPKTKQT